MGRNDYQESGIFQQSTTVQISFTHPSLKARWTQVRFEIPFPTHSTVPPSSFRPSVFALNVELEHHFHSPVHLSCSDFSTSRFTRRLNHQNRNLHQAFRVDFVLFYQIHSFILLAQITTTTSSSCIASILSSSPLGWPSLILALSHVKRSYSISI